MNVKWTPARVVLLALSAVAAAAVVVRVVRRARTTDQVVDQGADDLTER